MTRTVKLHRYAMDVSLAAFWGVIGTLWYLGYLG